MIKAFLSAVICTMSFMASCELHKRKECAAKTAMQLSECISGIISMLTYEHADAYTVAKEAVGRYYPEFSEITSDFPERWDKACENTVSEPESLRLMKLAGEIIGSADIETQTDRLKLLREDMRAHAVKLREISQSTSKLYAVLGTLFGMAVVIMII